MITYFAWNFDKFMTSIWVLKEKKTFFFWWQTMTYFTVRWQKKKRSESKLGFLHDYFFLAKCLGSQRGKVPKFFSENFWVPFCTPLVLFLPFFDLLGVLKKCFFFWKSVAFKGITFIRFIRFLCYENFCSTAQKIKNKTLEFLKFSHSLNIL